MDRDRFLKLDDMIHRSNMSYAIREAKVAAENGEVPAGCVIMRFMEDGDLSLVGKSHNMTEELKDPTAHAEVLAITQATQVVGDWRLTDCILYVTKEPCPMCAGAIVLARIPLVVWGVSDSKRGGATVFNIFEHEGINHHPSVIKGVCEEECLEILQSFFKERRKK